MNELELTGRARSHVVELTDPRCTLHHDAAQPFLSMRSAAARAGLDLLPVSGFRDFDAQLRIWNEKFLGRRSLFDRAGRLLQHAALSEDELVESILCWSALPGASRHHWGSEIDVIDGAALPTGRKPQLLPEEYGPGGPFERLNGWLEQNMSGFGFFRPYRTDRGGVAPEPWHLSYAPVSVPALDGLSQSLLGDTLSASAIQGREQLLNLLPGIYSRYVANVDAPPQDDRFPASPFV